MPHERRVKTICGGSEFKTVNNIQAVIPHNPSKIRMNIVKWMAFSISKSCPPINLFYSCFVKEFSVKCLFATMTKDLLKPMMREEPSDIV
jgi:hypothetical protein